MLTAANSVMDTVTFDVRLEIYQDLISDVDFDSAQRAVDYRGCFVKQDIRALHIPRLMDTLDVGGRWVQPKRLVASIEHYTSAPSSAGGGPAAEARPRAVVVIRTGWLGDWMVNGLVEDGWDWTPAEAVAW
jgi:hypothetical protein